MIYDGIKLIDYTKGGERMLRLLGCGHHFLHRRGLSILRPSGAGNFAFVLFKTEAEVLLNGQFVPAAKNSCIVFRPDTPQHYRDREKPYINDWIHCECVEEDFFADIGFPLDQLLPLQDPSLLSRRILELQSTLHRESSLRERILDSELRSLFCRIADSGAGQDASEERYSRHLAALRSEIYGSPQTAWTVESLAARANLSRSHFQHLYRELFGVPVMTDVINSRMEYAKHLLRGGSLPVFIVAEMCGYDNNVHFIRQFKRLVGTTPGRYRNG